MAVLLGPFEIGYPVAFEPGGDTTRDAFEKHIHEIEKIYGILNALDAGKVSSDDLDKLANDLENGLQNHINSTNPHPNWKISFDDLTGQLDGSKLKGRIEASLVYGLLSNAYIDAGHVNGLEALVKSLVGDGSGDGITDAKLEAKGYVKFANGFTIQWGNTSNTATISVDMTNKLYVASGTLKFVTSFSSKCLKFITRNFYWEGMSHYEAYSQDLTEGKDGLTYKVTFDYLKYIESGNQPLPSAFPFHLDYVVIGI